MYSFVCNDWRCPVCHVDLVGEGTVKVEGDLQSVNGSGRIVENIGDGNDLNDTDLILDYRMPAVVCQACGAELDYSYNREE